MRANTASFIAAVGFAILIGCGGVAGPIGGGGSTGGSNGGGGGGGATIDLTMVFMSFTPQEVLAHAGDTIRWTNTSILSHTVTSDTAQPGLSSGTIGNAATFSWTVPSTASVGTHFFYHCSFHGVAGNGTALGTGMAGEITVN